MYKIYLHSSALVCRSQSQLTQNFPIPIVCGGTVKAVHNGGEETSQKYPGKTIIIYYSAPCFRRSCQPTALSNAHETFFSFLFSLQRNWENF